MAKEKRQVSIGTKLSYGTGHSLLSAKNMLFHFFYLFFFANVLGVPEGLVVIATFAALFVDAVSDPLMGQYPITIGRKNGPPACLYALGNHSHGNHTWTIVLAPPPV